MPLQTYGKRRFITILRYVKVGHIRTGFLMLSPVERYMVNDLRNKSFHLYAKCTLSINQIAMVYNLISKSALVDEFFEMVMAVMSLPFFSSPQMSSEDEFGGYNYRDFDNHKWYVRFA